MSQENDYICDSVEKSVQFGITDEGINEKYNLELLAHTVIRLEESPRKTHKRFKVTACTENSSDLTATSTENEGEEVKQTQIDDTESGLELLVIQLLGEIQKRNQIRFEQSENSSKFEEVPKNREAEESDDDGETEDSLTDEETQLE